MKWNKKLKKTIMGGIGFTMAVVMFFAGSLQGMHDVVADVRVFDKITEDYPYEGDSFSLNILEIVPYGDTATNYAKNYIGQNNQMEQTANSYAEMGYFFRGYGANEGQNMSLGGATRGTALSAGVNHVTSTNYPNALISMRNYGLIRPNGADGTGEYPVYALKDGKNGAGEAVFVNYMPAQNYSAYGDDEKIYVKGVYSLGEGDYKLADGYTIDGDATICKVDTVTVSDNEVDENGNSISENNPTYDPVNKTIEVYTPVDDIDMSQLQLPTSKTGFKYIEAVPSGTGNVIFTRSEAVTQKTEYYGYSDQVLYYNSNGNTNFFSSDYFREYVLGSRTKYQNKDITYDVKQAGSVTKEDIEAADLVYISGKAVDFGKEDANDISEDVLIELYNKEVNDRKAVMMDYACYSAGSDTNVAKLAVLLWRESQSELPTSYANSFSTSTVDEETIYTLKDVSFLKGDDLRSLEESMMSGANGNFVTGNVYVYNHHLSDFDNPKSLVDAGDMFANGDFNSAYTTNVMQNGFAPVLNYINATNKNSTTGTMVPSVTPAIAIQYILISDGTGISIVKSSLNVLEIQPVSSFLYNTERGCEEYAYLTDGGKEQTNRDVFVHQYLSNYYDDKVEYVNFTSMTVDEFNGRNEDLIETYDIIYIGSEMGTLYNTRTLTTCGKTTGGVYSSTVNPVTKDLPVYNDTNMYGMVYYNIGDEVTLYTEKLGGFLKKNTDTVRYMGRDITRDKLQKLKNYLNSEGLVLVAEDLMSQNETGSKVVNPTALENSAGDVDHGRVDNSSNLYELLQYACGKHFNYASGAYESAPVGENSYPEYENLISVGDIVRGSVDKAVVDRYVATEKLSLTMTNQPREYSYALQKVAGKEQVMDPTTVQYMEEDAGGRKLKYEFFISSDELNLVGTGTYKPFLYVDVNNDGKYSTVAEHVKDVQIVVKASGEEPGKDADGNYILEKDVEYQMTRALDDSYSGYLKWKLTVQSNQHENSHASAEGSTVVKNNKEDKIVKILQITRDNGGSTPNNLNTNLNLEAQANNVDSKFGKYLAAVPGYDVAIRTMTVNDFETDFINKWNAAKGDAANPKSLQEFALEYFDSVEIKAPTGTGETSTAGIYGANMLVLGFGDNYPSFSNNDTIAAIKIYMESEKPVLLTHDFIMFFSDNQQAAYLRNSVGMDKYGMTQDIVEETTSSGQKIVKLVNSKENTPGEKDYLYSGDSYNRAEESNSAIVSLIESTGKSVAYKPGTGRRNVLKDTQGLSNSIIHRYRKSDNKWLYAPGVSGAYQPAKPGQGESDDNGGSNHTVIKLNEGQLTSYPYALPESFQVAQTHGQYFALDMDADNDSDGESDVVVWYSLSNSNRTGAGAYDPYNNNAGGPVPADSFYIYNKGNITYTGAGHSNMESGSSEVEAQLFINTLFAAFNAGKTSPSAGFYENAPDPDDMPISTLAIPYDENVTAGNTYDSSILKDALGAYRYQFVNPNIDASLQNIGTPIFFRLNDTNFVRGNKYIEIEYYLKAEGNRVSDDGTQYQLDDGTTKSIESLQTNGTSVPVVNISDKIVTYKVENRQFAGVISPDETTHKLSTLESGQVYGFYLPMSYLNYDSHYTIYIKSKTRIEIQSSQTGGTIIETVPGEGVSDLTVIKTDLLDLE